MNKKITTLHIIMLIIVGLLLVVQDAHSLELVKCKGKLDNRWTYEAVLLPPRVTFYKDAMTVELGKQKNNRTARKSEIGRTLVSVGWKWK